MFIGNEHCEVETGDMVYVPPKTDQYVKNVGDKDLCFICIVSPPWSEETEEVF